MPSSLSLSSAVQPSAGWRGSGHRLRRLAVAPPNSSGTRWSSSPTIAGLLAGCAACQRDDGCALLALETATPVLLPIGIAGAVARVASAPFDTVYPSFVVGEKEVAPLRRFELPFPVDAATIDDDGTVTGFPAPASGQVAACAPHQACSLVDTAAVRPAPRPGCVVQSPDRAYCLDVSPLGRRMVASPGNVVVATLPGTFTAPGLATVSEGGEVFSPATDGGYDRTDAHGTSHHPSRGPRTIFVARLGRRDTLVQVTGSAVNGSSPQVLHLLDAGTDREVASLALPSQAVSLYNRG